MSRRVLLLPGQGTQFVGMANAYTKFQSITEILQRVDESLKFSVIFDLVINIDERRSRRNIEYD